VIRVLLTIGLITPAAYLFLEQRNDIDARESTASRELLGVEYLRALEPLGVALGTARSAVLGGASADIDAAGKELTTRIEAVASVDQRVGAELGVRERWTFLRGQIEALPTRGERRLTYTSYVDVLELEVELVNRVALASGLVVDQSVDALRLQLAVTDQLPEITAVTGQLADLAELNKGVPVVVTDLASMLELREDAIGAGAELVEAMEAAATATTDNQLVGNVFASLDAVRGDLDQLAPATGAVTDGDVTAVDAQVVVTMRGNLTKAASTLSTAIFDQLTGQLTERKAAAERDRQFATAALALVILLALFPTGTGLRDLLRHLRERRARERLDEEPPIGPGPQWTRETAVAGRERAGAAR
jgi:hypothetical protein